MSGKLDTNRLFLAQVTAHVEELTDLLSLLPQERVDDRIDRSMLSTSMLASSASLMELSEWESFLTDFDRMLALYKDKNLPWDERIAQLVSEMIEREETIVAEWSEQSVSIRELFVPEHWQVMSLELDELVKMCEDAASRPDDWDAPAVERVPEPEPPVEAEPTGDTDIVDEPLMDDRPLACSMKELQDRVHNLLESWDRASWNLDDATPADLEAMRRDLHLIDFYARTLERTLTSKSSALRTSVASSLEPVRSAISDYAHLLCSGTNRHVDVIFLGETSTTDVRLLLPVQRVVQLMIGDIFLRCDDEYLRVEVHVRDREGSLLWSIRDNGSNFMTDSPIDPGEYLAFYPGLRETSRVLQRLRSLLWVEPDEDQETRFAFTIPDTPEGGRFTVWGDEGDQFAVPSSQVSAVLEAENADIHSDDRGEFIAHEGRRAPLLSLGQLYSRGPAGGRFIAVIGCLEKRIAFYVESTGRIETGDWLRNAVPLWHGTNQGAAEIDATKMPLVEANSLIEEYSRMTSENQHEGLSGGAAGDDNDLSQRQAQMVKDAAAPPDSVSKTNASARVLVVERSAALREELTIILANHSIDAKVVERLDDAVDWLKAANPSLIVSEFRAPTLAAKTLAEQVDGLGRETPILVTTSHDGEDADLLVSKLGVAGYISKPFEPADVWHQIETYLDGVVEVAPR